MPSFVRARTSYHNTAEEIQLVGTHGMRGYMVGKNVVDKLNICIILPGEKIHRQ